MPRKNIIHEKSFEFAVQIVNTTKVLVQSKEFVLSKQLLRSCTSIGANVRESKNAVSKKDFVQKLSISLKECDESIYWIELLYETKYLTESQFNTLNNKALELLRILTSIVKTTRGNMTDN